MTKPFTPIGDSAIRISFENEVSPKTHQKIIAFKKKLELKRFSWIIDIIPGFTTLSIVYRPVEITYKEACEKLEEILQDEQDSIANEAIIYHIPVCYESPYQLDLEEVARLNRLSVEDVINIHKNQTYYVYFLGFLPGFAYLGGMDSRIATPRLAEPRRNVPAGSIGIAGEQTGIYPLNSPGGWRIIGRTPVRVYDRDRIPPSLLLPGNFVRFHSISRDEFQEIAQQVKEGIYEIKTTAYKGDSDACH